VKIKEQKFNIFRSNTYYFAMNTIYTSWLLSFYGLFLITSGIVSVIFIGMKAKTALLSGGMSGVISFALAYLNHEPSKAVMLAALFVPFALFIVFSWRSAKTLFRIFELIPSSAKEELNGKGIAFLIISLMAITSLFVFAVQLIHVINFLSVSS
jgi:uncharacterized membrane protein (UPF0136 family)